MSKVENASKSKNFTTWSNTAKNANTTTASAYSPKKRCATSATKEKNPQIAPKDHNTSHSTDQLIVIIILLLQIISIKWLITILIQC